MKHVGQLLTLLFGVFVITFIIYTRLRIRDFHLALNVFSYISVFFFLFCLYCLLILAYVQKYRSSARKFVILNKFFVLVAFPFTAMKAVYKHIFNAANALIRTTLFIFARSLLSYSQKQLTRYLAVASLLFDIFPRVVTLSIFLYEVLFTSELHYFFVSLSLLIIPVCFNFFVFIIEDIGPRLIDDFNTYTYVREVTASDGRVGYLAYFTSEKADPNDLAAFLHYNYMPMFLLLGYIRQSLAFRQKLLTYFSVFYHGILLLGWGFVLYLTW